MKSPRLRAQWRGELVYLATRATAAERAAYEAATHTSGVPNPARPEEARRAVSKGRGLFSYAHRNGFRQWTSPFPQTVAIDEVRRAFLAYGVSGTPTIVLVDGQGIVRSYSTGYSSEKGLGIDGWSWRDRPAQKP